MLHQDTGQWDESVAIAVVGGGACGLTAALAAAQHGVNVLLFEKERTARSNTARSSGMIPAAGTRFQREAGVEETPEDFARDILAKNHHASDPEVTLLQTRTIPLVVEWLVDEIGVDLRFVDDFTYPGHSKYRMHAPPDRTGAGLHRDMQQAVDAHPHIESRIGTAVVGLVVDDERHVVGVVAETDGEPSRVRCDKAILATNGFGANPELVAKYTPAMSEAMYFGSEGNTGEGILWGEALGAELDYMDAYQAHNSVAVPQGLLMTYALVTKGGFQVNAHGQRFGTEDQGYSERALEVLAQPDGIAWNIFDGEIHDFAMAFDYYRQGVEKNAILSAGTIETLASKLGIDADGLEATLVRFNRAASGDMVDEQGRTPDRPLRAPFYGVRVTGALFHTQGGLRVNEHAQVLREDGSVVGNLYAGGGTAAGVSGHGPAGYLSGNGLLTAFVYGYLAGNHAATA
jgi:fumarate reductase flavoprotein subunit